MAMTDDEIRAIVTDYNDDLERALQRRDERLRSALASGRRQADLVKLTEYSRETIRQALNPEIREAVRKARASRGERL